MDLFTPPLRGADLVHIRAVYLSDDPAREPADPDLVAVVAEVEALREIVRLTAEVRAAQRAYFSSRAPGCLDRSKRLERELDRRIRDLTS
jgi:hypothetical protein